MKKSYLKNSIKKKKIIYEYYLYYHTIKDAFIIVNRKKKCSYRFVINKYLFAFYRYDMDGIYNRKGSYFPIKFNKNVKDALNSEDTIIKKLIIETICNKYLDKIKQLKSDKNLINNFNYFRHI